MKGPRHARGPFLLRRGGLAVDGAFVQFCDARRPTLSLTVVNGALFFGLALPRWSLVPKSSARVTTNGGLASTNPGQTPAAWSMEPKSSAPLTGAPAFAQLAKTENPEIWSLDPKSSARVTGSKGSIRRTGPHRPRKSEEEGPIDHDSNPCHPHPKKRPSLTTDGSAWRNLARNNDRRCKRHSQNSSIAANRPSLRRGTKKRRPEGRRVTFGGE